MSIHDRMLAASNTDRADTRCRWKSACSAADKFVNSSHHSDFGVNIRCQIVVAKVMDFGAFVNFLGPKDGLVHISELKNERVGTVTEVVNEGDEVKVKVIGLDDRGKVKLSMRVVDQETGEELEDTRPPREPREGGDDRPRRPRKPRAAE